MTVVACTKTEEEEKQVQEPGLIWTPSKACIDGYVSGRKKPLNAVFRQKMKISASLPQGKILKRKFLYYADFQMFSSRFLISSSSSLDSQKRVHHARK